MDIDINKKSVSGLLSDDAGFYIPSFQRSFSWGEGNIRRLFEDVAELHDRFARSRQEEYLFLGTVLTVSDKKHEDIMPVFFPHLPREVKTIIDGQQRISALTIINVVLHDKLSEVLNEIKEIKNGSNLASESLLGLEQYCLLLQRVLSEIYRLFVIDMHAGECQYYPKVIRALDDVWSRVNLEKRYSSPLGEYLWKYINHCGKGQYKKFSFKTSYKANKAYKSVLDAHREISKCIESLCGLKDRDKYPSTEKVGREVLIELVENIDAQIEEGIKLLLLQENSECDIPMLIENGIRLILLAKLIGNGICFITSDLKSMADAFSIFDSLNTTGEQLTAIETFKPTIVKEVGIKEFPTTVFHEHFESIRGYFDRYTKPEDKQDMAAQFVINFALAEEGETLGKKLRDQRQFLKQRYSKIIDIGADTPEEADTKKDFTRRLSYLSDFMTEVWDVPPSEFVNSHVTSEESKVTLKYLSDLNHTIVIPSLSLFYSKFRRLDELGESVVARKAVVDFHEVLLATAAFTTLWRAAWGSTGIMAGRFSEVTDKLLSFKQRCLIEFKDTDIVTIWLFVVPSG